jgi:cytochrome c peroxidase
VAVSEDGRWIAVAHAGTHEISMIDAARLHERLAKRERTGLNPAAGDPLYAGRPAGEVAEDLAFLVGLRRRVPVQGKGPRGLATAGERVVAAEFFSDSLAVVSPGADETERVRLGPAPEMTRRRRGEMLFHDASLCFQEWQSCSSCHPDARADGLNWDLLNDGIGNPKNTKSMLLAHRTPPAMSLGVRATAEAAVRAGIRHIQFMKRPEEEAAAIDEYLRGLEAMESPELEGGELSAAAVRGRALFEGKAECARCHPAPLYTDLKSYDVDGNGEFDTPALVEAWRTAPYNHDGRWTTLEELLEEGDHGGMSGKLTEKELADLAEFVGSL